MSDEPTNASSAPPSAQAPFFIVGIGASAGGLEALEELMKHVSYDRLAFVVVQHLSPTHESMLTQLLGRSSRIEVVTAADGMRVEPNRVYVLPPNADLALLHGALRLTPLTGAPGPRLPVDSFFRSLADDQGPLAIGIVLSGTGTDGTLGLKAIKAAGGITFVQEPSTAKYDGMPQSALASGSADFRLAPASIAAELRWLATRPAALQTNPSFETPEAGAQLARLFVLIRSQFGNDLNQYKPGTVHRRVDRRMALHKLSRLEDYVRLAQSDPEELRALYGDMLIGVTRFFRDREPFTELQQQVFPHLVANRPPNTPLRVWVPACATGEEVYSVAIALIEFLEEQKLDLKLQLFGTDVDDGAIEAARRGSYPRNIALDVSPARLRRFFVEKETQYQISRRVRDCVVFSRHNLYKDPPFSRIDLVSCRNLLIYLQPATQSRVLRVLHHALAPNGYLLLGSSETVGDSADLFSLVDRKHRIYAKKQGAGDGLPAIGFGPVDPAEQRAPSVRSPSNLQALADRKLLDRYAPPALVINDKLEIVHFRGHTGPFLDPAAGNATLDALRVVRPELRGELKRVAHQVLETQAPADGRATYAEDGKTSAVRLEATPLRLGDGDTRCLLLAFEPAPLPPPAPPVSTEPSSPGRAPSDERAAELERELATAREALQAEHDERAIAEEEFRAAREELQSANEELQSTNEELETSKEELQSTNQELTTVNDELQSRMTELSQANDDLHNVLLGVDLAVIIVGMDLRIRRYTPAAERLFNLVPSDVGRPIDFIQRFVGALDVTRLVTTVTQTLVAVEEQILSGNHRWYQLRISPYQTVDHAVRGAIVTLLDIDVRKKATDLSQHATAYASRYLTGVDNPLLIVDGKLRVTWANDVFFQRFQAAPEEVLGASLNHLGTREWFDTTLRDRVSATLQKGALFRDVPVPPVFPAGKVMKVAGSRVPVSTDAPMMLLSFEEL